MKNGIDFMRHAYPENRSGFTLTELLIVIALMGILLSLATMPFHSWQIKNNIEKQTKELFTDINDARTRSLYRKQINAIVLNPGSYSLVNYSTEDEFKNNNYGGTAQYTRNLTYQLTGFTAGTYVWFNFRGMLYTSIGKTIYINPPNSGAAFDCIVIDDVRTNMGKTGNGPSCNQQ